MSRVAFTAACRAATAQVAAGKPVGPLRLAGLKECAASYSKLPEDGWVYYAPGVRTSGQLHLSLDEEPVELASDCAEPEYNEEPGEPSFHAMGRWLGELLSTEACEPAGRSAP